MRTITIEPALMVYDAIDGVERVTVISGQALAMVVWANWQLLTILFGAFLWGIEQPYHLAVRFWLLSSFGLTAFAWALCEPGQALLVLSVILVSAVAESVALIGLWIDDNGGWS